MSDPCGLGSETTGDLSQERKLSWGREFIAEMESLSKARKEDPENES